MVGTGLAAINEDLMREAHSEQRHDQDDDLHTDASGPRNVKPDPEASATSRDNMMNHNTVEGIFGMRQVRCYLRKPAMRKQ